jgi:D-aminopeptidase
MKPRARDLGLPFDGTPGPLNAITDVAGVTVGHTTLIRGDGPLQVGQGPVRTGVTVVLPRGACYDPVFAAWHALNGNGEMTGTAWIDESGFLEGPIALTNTHSVGVVRDAVIAWQIEHGLYDALAPGVFWIMPVVAETYDGALNDINGFHVRPEHVSAALDAAASGPVAEGGVGGGTGMVCYGFKGGIGTASRRVPEVSGAPTVGVLVQANHGARAGLTIAGVPVGRELADVPSPFGPPPAAPAGTGSIIAIVATEAPLLPHQLKRLARRVSLGVARGGTPGEHYSGDLFLAFSVANPGSAARQGVRPVQMLSNDEMTPLFAATVQATEEAVLNALVAAETMTGCDGRTAQRLPHERVREILKRHGRVDL